MPPEVHQSTLEATSSAVVATTGRDPRHTPATGQRGSQPGNGESVLGGVAFPRTAERLRKNLEHLAADNQLRLVLRIRLTELLMLLLRQPLSQHAGHFPRCHPVVEVVQKLLNILSGSVIEVRERDYAVTFRHRDRNRAVGAFQVQTFKADHVRGFVCHFVCSFRVLWCEFTTSMVSAAHNVPAAPICSPNCRSAATFASRSRRTSLPS